MSKNLRNVTGKNSIIALFILAIFFVPLQSYGFGGLFSNPFKKLSIANTYRGTAQSVIKASCSLGRFVGNIAQALNITEIDSDFFLEEAEQLASSKSGIGEQVNGAISYGERSAQAYAKVLEALEAAQAEGYELNDNAKKKLSKAYAALIKGGVYQGLATKGGISLTKKFLSADAATEIKNAVSDPKLGMTEQDLRSFPSAVKEFAGNFKKGYSAVEKMRKLDALKDQTNKEATSILESETEKEKDDMMAGLTGDDKNSKEGKSEKKGGFGLPGLFGK